MRIDATTTANLVQASQNLNTRQSSISQQLSSGVRISSLSDDPLAAGRSATLNSTLAQQDTFLTTATTLTSRLTTADSALAAVVTQLTSAVSLAVQGANDTETTANRAAIASQVSGIRDTVLSLANSSYNGSYLFSGSGTTAPYALAADGTATYSGDSNVNTVTTLGGNSIATSAAGSSIFGDSSSPVFAALTAVITSLNAGTATNTADVANLRSALNVVITQRSSLDSSLSRVQSESTYVTTQQTNTKVEQTTLLAPNTVELATDLSATQSQQTALLSTLGKLNKTSLFDYL